MGADVTVADVNRTWYFKFYKKKKKLTKIFLLFFYLPNNLLVLILMYLHTNMVTL